MRGSLAIAVPTYRRPHLLAQLLADLTMQDLKPDVLLVCRRGCAR